MVVNKKKRGTNEHVEGQTWNVGVIHLLLDLYKEKYLTIGVNNIYIYIYILIDKLIMQFDRNFFMRIFIHGNKLSQSGVRCIYNITRRRTPLALTHKFQSGLGMNKWTTSLMKLERFIVYLKEWEEILTPKLIFKRLMMTTIITLI
jgi:hypothetical protein